MKAQMATKRQIQRTVVVTVGKVAGEAGQRLAERFAASHEPEEVVAILDVNLDETAADDSLGVAALRQVSLVTAREKLAGRGWTVDRLDEIAVHVVVDLRPDLNPEKVIALARRLELEAQKTLGVNTATLCLALVASPEKEATLAKLARSPSFVRGVVVLGMTNEMGLCLGSEEALATQAAHLLYALTATPLRDAPEWAREQVQGSPLLSMGLAVEPWQPLAERVLLGREWARQVFAAWLEDTTEPVRSGSWLAGMGWEAEKLLQRLRVSLPPAREKGPAGYPYPWQVKDRYGTWMELAAPAGEEVFEEIAGTVAEEMDAALKEAAAQMVDETPAGGLDRVLRFARMLRRLAGQQQDELEARYLVEVDRAARLEAQHARVAALLRERLARWPSSTWRSWGKAALCWWRWPGMAWHYWQMHQLARQLQQLKAEWDGWQREIAVNKAADRLYSHLAGAASRLEVAAEEVVDMVRSLLRGLDEEHAFLPPLLEAHPEYAERRLAHLVESAALEASWASAQIGGLGAQLSAADDRFLPFLLDEIEARIGQATDSSLEEALALLYPQEEQLKEWWRHLCEVATPLWRYDRTRQDEFSRSRPTEQTLVCGQAALTLRRRLEAGAGNGRWIEAPLPDLLVMRVRGGLPLEVEGDGAESDSLE